MVGFQFSDSGANAGHPSWGEISPGTPTTLQLLTRITLLAVWTRGWVAVEARLSLEVGDCG